MMGERFLAGLLAAMLAFGLSTATSATAQGRPISA